MPDMTARSRLDLVDQVLEGGALAYLSAARLRGQSFESIGAELTHRYQIPATAKTVARWCADLGIEVRAAS